eukprot:TRINITY_DN14706_c0_g1_i1.p1 TRINITY_DN14706_c0_g1~~TRINITY_DN14706_c0_g1_i1.p1  ORF type:complete len:294 (-),score=50.51 TRINITY_DN14706_c0_g1_i1:370-1221(-)
MVLAELNEMQPQVVEAVCLCRCTHQLRNMVRSWICTLLMSGYCPKRQSFKQFRRLFDRLLAAPLNANDHRESLRYIIVCVLMDCSSNIQQAANDARLEDYLEEVSSHIEVTDSLLELIDGQLDPAQCATYHVAAWAPFSMLGSVVASNALLALSSGVVAGSLGGLLVYPVAASIFLGSCKLAAGWGMDAFRESVGIMVDMYAKTEQDESDEDGRSVAVSIAPGDSASQAAPMLVCPALPTESDLDHQERQLQSSSPWAPNAETDSDSEQQVDFEFFFESAQQR